MSVLKIHLTYSCTAACDHCRFNCSGKVGSVIDPSFVMNCVSTLKELNGLQLVVLMGGEPGLYPEMTQSLTSDISKLGINVRIETNASWASDDEAATRFLEPLYRCKASVMFSLDSWHEPYVPMERVLRAMRISELLGGKQCLEVAYLDYPACRHERDKRTNELLREVESQFGKLPEMYQGTILFNGRAARKLSSYVSAGRGVPKDICNNVPWWSNGEIETLELLELDPYGNISKGCGISIGNMSQKPLSSIIKNYSAKENPIFATLLKEGPLGLAREAEKYGYCLKKDYADKCHLCQEAREILVAHYPGILTPLQHYNSS